MSTRGTRYYVYVLCNAAGTLYTGIAKNVEARLEQHNAGAGARFTRGRGPWRMVHREGPLSHGPALRREAELKADRRFKAALKARLGISPVPNGGGPAARFSKNTVGSADAKA